jgi:hypothetical protein
MRTPRLLILTGVCLMCQPRLLHAGSASLTLTASPATLTLRAGQPAPVTITQTNVGTSELCLRTERGNPVPHDFTVRIRDENGETPHLTELGEVIVGDKDDVGGKTYIVTESHMTLCLKPGASRVVQSDLAELYQLEPAHRYRVSFGWSAEVPGTVQPLRSNTATIAVNAR